VIQLEFDKSRTLAIVHMQRFVLSLSLNTYPLAANRRGDSQMTQKLDELLYKAKSVQPSPEQKEEQRRSFAYGNTNIENSRITRETVDQEAEELKKSR
jgi:hypothetical protein